MCQVLNAILQREIMLLMYVFSVLLLSPSAPPPHAFPSTSRPLMNATLNVGKRGGWPLREGSVMGDANVTCWAQKTWNHLITARDKNTIYISNDCAIS